MLNSQRSPEAVRLPILTFSLGDHLYALLIEDVVEVNAMVEITPLPDAPPEVLGIVNRHGKMLPLLDLRLVFKQPAPPVTSGTLFIVAAGGSQHIGLVVDEVHQVEYVDALRLGDAPTTARYLHGIIGHEASLIPILALPALLAAFVDGQTGIESS
jgi:purine-binding chemotaxis protein CheW